MGKDQVHRVFTSGKDDGSVMCAVLSAAAVAGVRPIVGVVDVKAADYKHNVHPTGVSPAVETGCGRYVAGPHAVLTYLAEQGDCTFAGRTTYEKSVVASFLQLAYTQLPALDAKTTTATLKDLSAWLETRTFLVSERLTVADIAVAFALLATYKKVADRSAFVDLNRWMDTVLNHPKVSPFASGEYKAPVAEDKKGGDKKAEKKDKKGGDKAVPEWKKEAEAKKQQKNQKAAVELNGGVFDLRVGEIKKVEKHPTADSLYVEMIDVGEEEPRQICSGLVKHMAEADLLGKKVLVMCNLKPAKLVGTFSYGMVMCSTGKDEKVHLCKAPEGAVAGDKVTMEKYETGAAKEQVPSKKVPDLLDGFHTDAKGTVMWKDSPLAVKGKGDCTSPEHLDCKVR